MFDRLFDKNTLLKRIYFSLFIIFLFEILIGGGGRLIESGFFSIRIYLFFSLLLISLPLFIKFLLIKLIDKSIIILLIIYTIILLIGIIVARFNSNNNSLIFIDIKPLSFFYSIIFIYLFVQEQKQIELIKNLIKFSGFLMAIFYICCFLLLNIETEWFDFKIFYDYLYPSGEFFFRGSVGFFYKGFFYMCIGFIFFVFDKKKYSKYIAGFIFIAIFLTFTRGFLLALILAFLIYFILSDLKNIRKISFAILGSVLLLIIISFILNTTFIYLEKRSPNSFGEGSINRNEISNQERFKQIQDVFNEVSSSTIIQGYGFGKGVKSRNIHMEISYLEIFHKQGLIGLAMWFSFFIIILRLYKKSVKINLQKETNPFFVSVIFTYLVSLTNPFINSPFGLTIIGITIVYLLYLVNKNKKIALL